MSQMNFFYKSGNLNEGDVAIVTSSHKCFVRLLDDANFGYFKRGQSYYGYGGYYENFPVRLIVPSLGNWNVVIHLGPGQSAQIRYSINFFSPPRLAPDP